VLDGSVLAGLDEPQVAVTLRAAASSEVLGMLCRSFGLSSREIQLAYHLVDGLTTQQIAERLCISPYTVKDHIKAVFRKVGTNTRGELVSELTGRTAQSTTRV